MRLNGLNNFFIYPGQKLKYQVLLAQVTLRAIVAVHQRTQAADRITQYKQVTHCH